MLYPEIMVDQRTELYGVLGNPVRHSLSPFIHNAAFKHFKINAAYLAFQVEVDFLGLAFEGIRSLGLKGVNITIPHKEMASRFVDEIPEDVDRSVGAINTVVNKGGRLFGYNTDIPGFLLALKEELGFDPQGKRCLVLGAGGASRGVVFALALANAERIMICNRTLERARGLCSFAADSFPEVEVEAIDFPGGIKTEKIDLVVNATSLGMQKTDGSPIDISLLKTRPLVYDLIYSPLETPLLSNAKKLGLLCANGLGMLAAQAAFSFKLWTGEREGVRELMLETLKKCPA